MRFDPATGAQTLMEAMRYRSSGDADPKILWLTQGEGEPKAGLSLPMTRKATWLDQGEPWAYFTIEEMIENADVEQQTSSRGQDRAPKPGCVAGRSFLPGFSTDTSLPLLHRHRRCLSVSTSCAWPAPGAPCRCCRPASAPPAARVVLSRRRRSPSASARWSCSASARSSSVARLRAPPRSSIASSSAASLWCSSSAVAPGSCRAASASQSAVARLAGILDVGQRAADPVVRDLDAPFAHVGHVASRRRPRLRPRAVPGCTSRIRGAAS